jgi:two-component system sensor histidine kinase RegB
MTRPPRLTSAQTPTLRPPVFPPEDETGRKNMLQLVQLRWIAVAGQVVTIAAVQHWFGIRLKLPEMMTILASLVILNIVSHLRLRSRSSVANAELFLALLLDVSALTGQLYLCGGVTNPFISLYLLQITLSAVLLEGWSTVAVIAITCLCCAGLWVGYQPIDVPGATQTELFDLYLLGMLICLLLDAVLLVVFVTRVGRNLRERDVYLADLRQQAAEEDHIVRMGLLASGAAHELGTPLATLSVILSDWRRMPAFTADPEMSHEIDDMQAEVQRCKSIVTGILLAAGEARGEAPSVTTVNQFLDEIIEEWRTTRGATAVAYDNEFGKDVPIVSDSALKQVICTVLDNALEASPRWVGFAAAREEETLVLSISDAGPGFAPEMLAGFGKPYHSTKGRLGGGLGLFLVVNVVRKLGGSVGVRNWPVGGATVTLNLPLTALAIGATDAG